ncbi:phosphatidylinositol N-acetylglucosaminyltransferase subunit Y-domain-containing protein [Cladochytrium replicatum]|nr:phosphatidylinositol N-acetylglucosaminyltransferase subunit Y-domain-containing protein [Cladochytrium replicatum]
MLLQVSSLTQTNLGRAKEAFFMPANGQSSLNVATKGWILLGTSLLFLVWNVYALLGSKLLPPTGLKLMDWTREDNHYSALFPLLIPTFVFFSFWSWMGKKLFKHN